MRKCVMFSLVLFVCLAGSSAFGGRSLGTTYLPLDHWANRVIERAMAKGAIPAQFLGQRPWTRTAIAQMLVERKRDPRHYAQDDESIVLVVALEREFEAEIHEIEGERVRSAQVDNVYTRLTGISGRPLRDSYHVGQTIVNDFGRPYAEGANNVTGGEVSGTYGVFGAALRAEYQHAPALKAYGATQMTALETIDHNPTAILPDMSQQDKVELLDTYVGVTWKRSVLSFGRESNWWGPSESSAMLMTDNTAPMYMLKWDVAQPVTLPWILKYLGPVRFQAYMGKMKGHLYPRQAYLHGEKVSLMPTKNLEIGFTRTTEWAGFGHPWTLHNLLKTYFSVGDQPNADLARFDPGDRRGGLDVTYKVPGLRNLLTVYTDSFVDDDPSPLSAPHRAGFHPGFYVSHIPGLPNVDFRAEGAYTQLPTEPNYNGYFFYTNSVYKDGYTNQGLLPGDWVGREGKGGQLSSTYWMAPDRTIEVFWRNHMVAPDFIPGGAHQNDFGTNINYAISEHFHAGGTLQYETYNIPFVAAGRQSDVTVGVTLTYWPGQGKKAK